MKKLSQNKNRRSIRLRGYDYSSDGWYFVTTCSQGQKCMFGDIKNGKIELTKTGEIIKKCWLKIPEHFQNVKLGEFIIMPNHMHGIIIIKNIATNQCRGGVIPPLYKFRPTLGQIVAYFKYKSTKIINKINNTPGKKFWQRNYYERIIRNKYELMNIRNYIINNPGKW